MVNALDTTCSGSSDDIQVSGIVSAIQDAASPSSTPSRFEKEFERLELLGRSDFGEVWRARNRVDQCEYAVKMVSYHFNQDEGPFAHPALREAQTWATVKHPNVVRYHAAWVEVDNSTEDQPFIDEGHKLPLPPVCAHVWNVAGDNTLSENSSGSKDSSDGGVLFEASTNNKADTNSTSVGTPLEVAPTTEGRHEMQIVPHHLPMPTISRKRRATLYVQLEFVRGGTLRQWIDRRNAGELAECFDKRQLDVHEMCTCCHEAGRKPPYRPVECPQYLNAALPVLCMPSF